MWKTLKKSQDNTKETKHNTSKSSNNYKDINTCIMIHVDHTFNFIQAKYDNILDAYEE